ncbi:4-coumarate--CoA ligase [Polymorphobacter multimanifer]|uniref:Acyl-CoA synthetase (AMP-forming)/AMP-acid ligase II n=1 Tax=Polymorphobacter multimanifer TaxID=1070431 RepID=A0A841L967_9SPHN|nr:AMP-binding protein [Polymorphobacter multimanifer]MBB6228970.1 acyl-CoA synthetase (AMP-forming)/AMP-acid ligase II [Polymorphobacter multimanifer]GGI73636.1 4-coumarate--CoA ligase [Polymorphobacter multimanifer]
MTEAAFASLTTIWATHARFAPDRTAAICGDRQLSWGEFDRGTNRVANALLALGAGRNVPVALVMGNSLEMLLLMFGIVKAGACMVPVSGMLAPPQLAGMLADSGAETVFVSEDCRGLVEAAGLSDKIRRIAIGFSADGWVDGDTLLAGASADDPGVWSRPEDRFNIIYSSGTTGLPKGIVQSHSARTHFAWSNALELGMSRDSVALATTALYSNGTMFMVLPPLLLGGTVVIMKQFNAANALALIEQHRVTHAFMVPTQCIVTLDDPACDAHDLSSLKGLLSAGSPLRADTRDAVVARMTPNLFELYGFSEGFATMRKPQDRPRRLGAVGRPVIGFDMRIVGSDDVECGPGEIGEIVGRGTGTMIGYHNRPDLDEAIMWRDAAGGAFLRSGDLGFVDDEGFLHIVDRKKDMILSGGFNIYPADLEAVIGEHPDVQDVTVIGVPHPKWGETPMALVIPRGTPDPVVLLAWANERLARTQRLAGLELRTEFPRNALGKVLKRELRAAWEQPA